MKLHHEQSRLGGVCSSSPDSSWPVRLLQMAPCAAVLSHTARTVGQWRQAAQGMSDRRSIDRPRRSHDRYPAGLQSVSWTAMTLEEVAAIPRVTAPLTALCDGC
jgi:hypothetical protein